VQGLLRSSDAASAVPAPMIAISLGLYLALYAALLLAYVWVLFHMARKAQGAARGDDHAPSQPIPHGWEA